ncbi:hypothetical protein B5X24_HaOG201795 [Helicoverpa armigera]|nr:hypothetical protein B5X24_HaOG201795 [Helicoverpa armigera]
MMSCPLPLPLLPALHPQPALASDFPIHIGIKCLKYKCAFGRGVFLRKRQTVALREMVKVSRTPYLFRTRVEIAFSQDAPQAVERDARLFGTAINARQPPVI